MTDKTNTERIEGMEKGAIERARAFMGTLDERGFHFQSEAQRKAFPDLYSELYDLMTKTSYNFDELRAARDRINEVFPTAMSPSNSPARSPNFGVAGGHEWMFKKTLEDLRAGGINFGKLDGGLVVDLGCGSNNLIPYDVARSQFPRSYFVGVDLDIRNLLARKLCMDLGERGIRDLSNKLNCISPGLFGMGSKHVALDAYVHGNAEKLPLPDGSAGLVYTNHMFVDNYDLQDLANLDIVPLTWKSGIDGEKVESEINRVLVPRGLYAREGPTGFDVYQKDNDSFRIIYRDMDGPRLREFL